MTTLFRLLALPGLALLATGCFHTDESLDTCPGSCTTVAGRLVTSNGRAGIGGATVRIVWHSAFGLSASRTKATVTTDNAGNYRATFFLKDDELQEGTPQGYFEAIYAVDQTRYYLPGDLNQLLGNYRVKRDTTIQVNDYLIPQKAFVNLTLTNQSQLPDPARLSFAGEFGAAELPSPARPYAHANLTSDQLPGANPVAVPADQPLTFTVVNGRTGNALRPTEVLEIPAGTTRALTVTY